MDAFPQEIIDHIVLFACDNVRSQLLTVSRRFQAAVERHTWAIRMCSTKDIDDFSDKYRGVRCRYLREICFFVETQIPMEDLGPTTFLEKPSELRADDEEFTRQISRLFAALKAMEEREFVHNRPAGIRLDISTFNTSGVVCEGCGWSLQLLYPETLPVLTSISTIALDPFDGRRGVNINFGRPLDLSIIPAIISKLPNLRDLEFSGFYQRTKFIANYLRPETQGIEHSEREMRHAFASAMLDGMSTLPARMNHVWVYFWPGRAELDHADLSLPDLVTPLTYDPFSSALRVFSRRLNGLYLNSITVDSGLFWLSLAESTLQHPIWPYLTDLVISFNPESPSGAEYFHNRGTTVENDVGPSYRPGMTNDDSQMVPNNEVIEPFLLAAAKALKNMPLLEYFYLGSAHKFLGGVRLEWSIRFRLPKNGGSPKLKWRVGDWRPSEGVHWCFRDIGSNSGWSSSSTY